jgi:hypothetical protein
LRAEPAGLAAIVGRLRHLARKFIGRFGCGIARGPYGLGLLARRAGHRLGRHLRFASARRPWCSRLDVTRGNARLGLVIVRLRYLDLRRITRGLRQRHRRFVTFVIVESIARGAKAEGCFFDPIGDIAQAAQHKSEGSHDQSACKQRGARLNQVASHAQARGPVG